MFTELINQETAVEETLGEESTDGTEEVEEGVDPEIEEAE